MEAQLPDRGSAAPLWIPAFRSPDRLFSLYRDAEWLLSARPSEPALADLLALQLPAGLTMQAFTALIRKRLLGNPAVQQIEAALGVPQRFGVLTERLRAVLPESTHERRQASLQVLLRWLIYFAGDHFRMDTSNYSEIVSLR